MIQQLSTKNGMRVANRRSTAGATEEVNSENSNSILQPASNF